MDRGGLGAAFAALGPGFAFQSALGSAFESVSQTSLLGTFDVASYATGGAGTSASPWTGWEVCPWASYASFYFRAGYYQTALLNLMGFTQSQFAGAGSGATHIICTGSGNVIQCGTESAATYKFGIVIRGMRITSTGTATNGVYLASVHHSTLSDLKITDVTNAAVYHNFGVANTIIGLRVTGNEADQTVRPAYGIYATRRAPADQSSTLLTVVGGHIDQTTTAGIWYEYMNGANHYGLAVEGNSGKGVYIGANSAKNVFHGLHLEENVGTDLETASGAYGNQFHGIFCGAIGANVGNAIIGGGRNVITGSEINHLTINGDHCTVRDTMYALSGSGAYVENGTGTSTDGLAPASTQVPDIGRHNRRWMSRTKPGDVGLTNDPGYNEFGHLRIDQITATPTNLSSTVYATGVPWRVLFIGYFQDNNTGPGLAQGPIIREVTSTAASFVVGGNTLTVTQTVGGLMQIAVTGGGSFSGYVGTMHIVVGKYATGLSATSLIMRGLVESAGLAARGSTSGTATVQAPAVAGTTTITLPGATGTLATLAGAETFSGKGFIAGTGTDTYAPSGLLASSHATVATDDATEKTLQSYTLLASTLVTSGAAIRVRAWGTTGANGDTKTIRFYFGAASITVNPTTTAPNAQPWELTAVIARTGSNAQRTYASATVGTATQAPTFGGSATETEAGTVLVKVTGQSATATASNISCYGWTLEFLPAAL